MTKKSSSLVFFGNERLSSGFTTTAPALRSLITAGYSIKAVVVNQAGKGQRQLEIAKVATENHIPVLSPNKPSDAITILRNFRADIGVLIAYGKIIPEEIINIFPHGILNVHPSLLPLYRGSTPVEQAMIDGAGSTGVSIMQLVSTMDAGPVYAQQKISLAGQEEKQVLTEKLLDEGANLLLSILPDILANKLQPKPQDEAKATYCALISKESGRIDWGKPAIQTEREIRAYAGWPNSHCSFGKLKIIITKAKVSPIQLTAGQIKTTDGKLVIGCLEGSLEILELKPAGKNNMSATAFLNGYRQLLT